MAVLEFAAANLVNQAWCSGLVAPEAADIGRDQGADQDFVMEAVEEVTCIDRLADFDDTYLGLWMSPSELG